MPRLGRWAAAVGVALLAVSLIVALSRSRERYAGTNDIRSVAPVVALGKGRTACQSGEVVPRDAAFVEFVAGAPASGATPPVHVSIEDASGAAVADGRVGPAQTGAGGLLAVPIPRQSVSHINARVCLRNEGRTAMSLYGSPAGPGGIEVDGRPQPALVRIGYREATARSWFAVLPQIAHRVGIAKASWVGAWTFWLLVALMAGVAVLAVRLVLADADADADGRA